MPRKDHSPEQVLNKLRQVEVAVAGGRSGTRCIYKVSRKSRLFRPLGVFRVSISKKPPHHCEGFRVRLELERETRIELATLCLGSKCSTTELLPLNPVRICGQSFENLKSALIGRHLLT